MLSATFFFVVSGCLLGAVQIAVGIALGMWLRRGDGAGTARSRAEFRQAERIAQRLQALADDMSSCVDEHRLQIERASQELTASSDRFDDSLADVVASVIAEVVGANQTLQTKLESAEARLQEQAAEIEAHMSRAMTDVLTGLPNRRELNERLAASMEAWRGQGEIFSLLMLDIDHFKELNDRNGHVAGDHVLKAVGQALRSALRPSDVVARYGGEEFAILFSGTGLDEATCVARRVRHAIAVAETSHDGRRFQVTISGGLAMISKNEQEEALISRADAALYAAKQAGRNRIYVHDGERCVAIDDSEGPARTGSVDPTLMDESSQVLALLNVVEALVRSGRERHGARQSSAPYPTIISAQLSEACEELRRLVAARRESVEQPVAADASR